MKGYLHDLAVNLAVTFGLLGAAIGCFVIGWSIGGTWGLIAGELVAIVGLIALTTWMYRR